MKDETRKKPKWIYSIGFTNDDGPFTIGDDKHYMKVWSLGFSRKSDITKAYSRERMRQMLRDGWVLKKYLAFDWSSGEINCLFWKPSCVACEVVDAMDLYR